MKYFKIIITGLALFFILTSYFEVGAQGQEQPAAQPLEGGQPQTAAQGTTGVPTAQTQGTISNTVKSNMLCVKVGTPSEDQPQICKQAAFGAGIPGNFTYYCQGDPQWDEKGNKCSIGQVGCGPTSMAMIFSYFGDIVDPKTMTDTYFSNNLMNCGVGSIPANVNAWVNKQPGYVVGPNIGQGILNATEAKKYINDGWLILGSSDQFTGQTGSVFGHIFVVQDVDPAASTFVMRDPENCSYGNGQENPANIVQPIKSSKIPSWAYAYPIRKETTLPQPIPGGNQNDF